MEPRAHQQTPIIHCIGDSHSCFFIGRDKITVGYPSEESVFPFFRVFPIGPALAYNLCKEGTSSRGRENLFAVLEHQVPPGGWVLMSFGEIDCRAHLLLQAEKQGRPWGEIVTECVARYFQVIQEVAARGFQVIVYNATPAARRRASYRPGRTQSFPTYGTPRERNRVTREFNEQLSRRCAEAGIRFLRNFDALVEPGGLTRRDMMFDGLHLSQKAMDFTLRRLNALLPPEFSDAIKPSLDEAGAGRDSDGGRPTMNYIKRKLANAGRFLHPRHLGALLRGAPSEERKAIRESLRPRPAPHTSKQAVLREYGQKFGCRVLIETGTFRGDMIAALQGDFARLHSIELSPELHRAAVERFARQPHIRIHQGDSAAVLPRLLKEIQEPVVFWLDGHSSGGVTAKGEINTPILAELQTILDHPVRRHVIIIDDAREFGVGKHYPSLERIRLLVAPVYPGFEVRGDLIRITPGA
jgi:lysophospholipase L1-like esterase